MGEFCEQNPSPNEINSLTAKKQKTANWAESKGAVFINRVRGGKRIHLRPGFSFGPAQPNISNRIDHNDQLINDYAFKDPL